MPPASDLAFTDDGTTLAVECSMPAGRRVLFALLGLFPLVAPYELLLKPRWTGYANVFFLLSAAVSLGAIALSLLLFFAALAGLRSSMRFDRARGVFSHADWSPLSGARRTQAPFAAISAVGLEKHDWSDGPPSWSLEVALKDGRTFRTASGYEKAAVEALRDRVRALLA